MFFVLTVEYLKWNIPTCWKAFVPAFLKYWLQWLFSMPAYTDLFLL